MKSPLNIIQEQRKAPVGFPINALETLMLMQHIEQFSQWILSCRVYCRRFGHMPVVNAIGINRVVFEAPTDKVAVVELALAQVNGLAKPGPVEGSVVFPAWDEATEAFLDKEGSNHKEALSIQTMMAKMNEAVDEARAAGHEEEYEKCLERCNFALTCEGRDS